MKFIDAFYIHNLKRCEYRDDEKEAILAEANRRFKSLGAVLNNDLVNAVRENVWKFRDAKWDNVEWIPDERLFIAYAVAQGSSGFAFVYK